MKAQTIIAIIVCLFVVIIGARIRKHILAQWKAGNGVQRMKDKSMLEAAIIIVVEIAVAVLAGFLMYYFYS